MADFVIGDNAALLGNQQPVLLFQTGDDSFHSGDEIGQMDALGTASCRQERGLINKIGKIGPGVKPGVNSAICTASTSAASNVFFR